MAQAPWQGPLLVHSPRAPWVLKPAFSSRTTFRKKFAVIDEKNDLNLYRSREDAQKTNQKPQKKIPLNNCRVALAATHHEIAIYPQQRKMFIIKAKSMRDARACAAALATRGTNEVEAVLAMPQGQREDRHPHWFRNATRNLPVPNASGFAPLNHFWRAAVAILRVLAWLCPNASILPDTTATVNGSYRGATPYANNPTLGPHTSSPTVGQGHVDRVARAAKSSFSTESPGPSASSECIVCMDAPRTHAMLPCGHHCVCADCSHKLDRCPICSQTRRASVRIYT